MFLLRREEEEATRMPTCYDSPVFWHIQSLVETLSKKTYKTSAEELEKLIRLFGRDVEIFLIAYLLQDLEINSMVDGDKKITSDKKIVLDLLGDRVHSLSDKQYFGIAMRQAFVGAVNIAENRKKSKRLSSIKAEQIETLCSKVLKLSTSQQISVGLGLSDCEDPLVSVEGVKLLVQTVFGLVDSDDKDIGDDLVGEVVWVLRSHLLFATEQDLANSCMVALATAFPESRTSLEVAPLMLQDPRCVDALNGDPGLAGRESGQDLNLATVVDSLGVDSILLDLGCAVSQDESSLMAVLSPIYQGTDFNMDDNDVARVLAMMAASQSASMRPTSSPSDIAVGLQASFARLTTLTAPLPPRASGSGVGWNVAAFISVAKRLAGSNLDADKIIRKLDKSKLSMETLDSTGFELIGNAYRLLKGTVMPGQLLLDTAAISWRNKKAQMAMLYRACFAPSELVQFTPTIKVAAGAQFPVNGSFLNLDVISNLDSLAGTGYYHYVKSMYENAAAKYPECLLVGLLQLDSPYDTLREEIYAVLVPSFLQRIQEHKNNETQLETVKQVWRLNSYVVLRACVAIYARDAKFLPFIVEVVRLQPEGLQRLLGLPLLRLVFDAACLVARLPDQASRPDFLELWMNERINSAKQSQHTFTNFARSLLAFVFLKASQQANSGVLVAPQQMHVMVKKLVEMSQVPGLPKEFVQEVRQFYERYQQQLAVKPEAPEPTPVAPNKSAPDYVEQQANAYFQMIYKSQKSIPEILELLTRFKNSDQETERGIFNCMVHNLFDEYRFLHKYPEKELQITGILFGSLINQQLVVGPALGIAIKFVIEALKKPHTSPMFRFGVLAVTECRQKLHEMPNTCTQIVQIPHFKERYPDLVQDLENFAQEDSKSASLGTQLMQVVQKEIPQLRGTETDSSAYASVCSRIDGLIGGAREITAPSPPDIEDEMCFVINNLTQRNMDEKVEQTKRVIKKEHFEWIAYYLVVMRVRTQANFHAVYMTFLEKLGDAALFAHVKDRTLTTVRELLMTNDIVSSSAQRLLLKNLGMWLGRLTLARNKPLLYRDVDLKGLLIDGYERGWLIAVVPFAAKVLDGTKGSAVFVPTNPWLTRLLSLLAELYHLADLKLNLKFEIEVLCKNLSIDLKSVEASSLLPSMKKPQLESNPDFNTKTAATTSSISPATPVKGAPVPSVAPVTPLKNQPKEESTIPNLAAYVHINASLQLFQQQPSLKRLVPLAVDRAIREIIQPVVERSVTIACMSCKELVTKDFAMEPDDKRMQKAAHMMVSNLAGSLALVTCKDPLRVAIGNQLRQLIMQGTPTREDMQLVEQAVLVCASENLEIGCMLIEKAATEKAMRDIDEQMESALSVRREGKKNNTPFFDMSVSRGRFPSALPDQLRATPSSHGLTSHQLMVYEAFQRPPRQARPQQAVLKPNSPVQKPFNGSPTQNPVGSNLDKWRMCISQLDRSLQVYIQSTPSARQVSLRSLSRDHEIFVMLRELKAIGTASPADQREEVILLMSQRLFKRLFEIGPAEKLTLETQFAILEIFRDLCKDGFLRRHLTEWMIFAPNEHKLNRTVVVGLARSKLLLFPDLDQHVAKMLELGRPAVAFAMDLILECIVQAKCIQVTEFLTTLDSLQNIAVRSKQAGGAEPFPGLQQLLDNVRAVASSEQQQLPAALFMRSNDPSGLREQVAQLLRTWLQLCARSDSVNNESVHTPYLTMLQQQGALKGDENADRFFRITTELCVEYSLNNIVESNGRKKPSYVAIDAFTKLVVLLVRYAEVRGKTALLAKVLEVIAGVLRREFAARKQRGVEGLLDQRPYFRLFLNLQVDVSELYESEALGEELTMSMLSSFAECYARSIPPAQLPVFAFSWLELISHKSYMPKMIKLADGKGWLIMERLLLDQLRFVAPYLKEVQLTPSTRMMYKGTLRVLLVLLHDFPEFLCSFHYSLCDAIPATCIQLRNLILSAFPRSMQLPDPFTPDLKIENLPESHKPPRILSNYIAALNASGLGPELETFLKSGGPFFPRMKEVLFPVGLEYNISLINSFVLFVGMFGMTESVGGQIINQSSRALSIFEYLAFELEPEGRYHLFNAIANQLRFPNKHTYYFSHLLLFLFDDVSSEVCKEQITRVLLERLIVHRPHPWGLLTTFIDLIKNPKFSFWDHPFTQCAPEIRRLFENVARSCMANSNSSPAATAPVRA